VQFVHIHITRNHFIHFPCIRFFFGSTGFELRPLHLNHTPIHFCVQLFFILGLMFLPSPISDCDPPEYGLLCSWDDRHIPQHLIYWLRWGSC
jgi:hypothetical protein